jgi:hypothetical protein
MDDMDKVPQPEFPARPTAIPGHVPPPFGVYQPPPKPSSRWLKTLLAYNPFYLLSAAMLLYGLYLVSLDKNFPGREAPQLLFNFGALQFYELLVVVTAIFLARRRIWHDSLLLVGLESLLVLLPFILLNQAALLGPMQALDRRIFWLICLGGGTAALARFWGLKHFFRELNLPARMLVCGLLLLLINLALPLVFRHIQENNLGKHLTTGVAYETNRGLWLLLLPAMFALANLLPRPRQNGGLPPQHRWLPAGLFSLWLAVSGVHLYCMSYVYDFEFEFIFLVPLLWVVMWSLYWRHNDFLARPVPNLSQALLALPVLATFLAMSRAGNMVLLALTTLNIVFYVVLLARARNHRTALHALLVSLAVLASGLARAFEPRLPAEITPEKVLLLGGFAYAMFWIIR